MNDRDLLLILQALYELLCWSGRQGNHNPLRRQFEDALERRINELLTHIERGATTERSGRT